MSKKEEKKEAKKGKKDPKEAKIEELTLLLQRVQAEFENFKKRVEKDNKETVQFASKEIILKLLPLIDNFELAFKTNKQSDEFAKGIELIYSQLFSILSEQGVKPIESLGKKFDPYMHEALMQEKSDKEEGTIIEEFQKGYMLHDKVLRHTKVKVAKK